MIFSSTIRNKTELHFQCSTNMTLKQINEDINMYISKHKDELYIDKTDIPVYFKRFVLVVNNISQNK